MQLIASASGVALYEDGQRLHVVDQRTGSLYTVAFLLIILPLILIVNGIAQIAIALDAGRGLPIWALGLTLAGVVGAIGLVLLLRQMRRRRAAAADAGRFVATFDFAQGQLLGPSGAPVAGLLDVVVRRRMQLASSSSQLVAEWGSGKLVLARGNPFGGGTGPLEDAFRAHGLMR